MFPLWLAIVIIFFFLVWLLIVKTDKNIFYYCDYVAIIHCVMIGQQQNNGTLHHQNYDLIKKPVITF